jgi:hypothetical protein
MKKSSWSISHADWDHECSPSHKGLPLLVSQLRVNNRRKFGNRFEDPTESDREFLEACS